MKKMPKSKNGPRSNFSFLPFELRFRVIGMIQDGFTAAAIAADPEVAKAYAALGSTFNRGTMTRIRRSAEYKEISAKRSARKLAEYDDRISAALLRENFSLETIADQTKVELLKAMSDLSDLSDMSDLSDRVKTIRQLVQSVTALSSQQKDNRIAELQRKLAEKDDIISAAEAEHRAREAELLARIAELENGSTTGISKETLSQVEEKIKLL